MHRPTSRPLIAAAAALALCLATAQPVPAATAADPRSPGLWQRTEAWIAHLLTPFASLFDRSEGEGDYGPFLDPDGLRARPFGPASSSDYGPELDPDGRRARSPAASSSRDYGPEVDPNGADVGPFLDPDGFTGPPAPAASGG